MGLEQVDKLLEMNESEVVSYLKAGAMKNLTFIPEFRQILKNAYASTISETYAPNYVVSTPVSYVVVTESEDAKDTYFKVLGKTYKIETISGEIDNITRKVVMSEVLDGFRPTIESIVKLCNEEKIGKQQSARVGFIQ